MKLIRKFLGLFTGEEASAPREEDPGEPDVIPRERHGLSRKDIDEDAKKVLNRLIRFNHTAYLVGGGVRDLLVGKLVKDFDIATSAHPNEVKKLFRNCRLVGRRFRLAHILFRGGKVIEVSTFRRQAGFGDDVDLLIRSDNTFGTAGEDALRRDFTINGLFYNIADFTVIDYVGGLRDLEAKVISSIGDPDIRFREDPIRMLRAIRLAARLQFSIAPPTRHALEKHRREIWKAAVPRILEELLRMLREGSAAEAFGLMGELNVLKVVLPRLAGDMKDEHLAGQVRRCLQSLDSYPPPGGGYSPALLAAVLYFPMYDALLRSSPEGSDKVGLAAEMLESDLAKLQFPRMQFERAKQILAAQPRLEATGRKRFRPAQLVRRAYFEDALTLFDIAMPRSRENRAVVSRWRALQKKILAEEGRPDSGQETKAGRSVKPRRRRRRGSAKKGGAPVTPAKGPGPQS